MVVEGTPLRQEYRFAAGSYSPSDDEDDSPPLLSDVELYAASAPMAAAFNPDDVAAALVEILASSEQITANERLCNRDYDTNMATLGGRLSRFEQIFSEVRDSIDIVRAESVSLVALNLNTRTMVCNSMANFLRAIEVSEQHNAITEQKNVNALAAYEQRVMVMAEVHTKSIGDMQAKLQSSFDRMKYLEKSFQNVPVPLTVLREAPLSLLNLFPLFSGDTQSLLLIHAYQKPEGSTSIGFVHSSPPIDVPSTGSRVLTHSYPRILNHTLSSHSLFLKPGLQPVLMLTE